MEMTCPFWHNLFPQLMESVFGEKKNLAVAWDVQTQMNVGDDS